MEVSYSTTVDDYVTFSLLMWRKSKMGRGVFLASWLLLPVVGLLGAAMLVAANGLSVEAMVCLGGVVLYAAVYPAVHRFWLTNHIHAYVKNLGSRGVIGPIRLILSEETLIEITETTRSEVKWRDMQGIEEVGDYTFIMITGMSAAILPRHGFEREDDYYKVRDYARARISPAVFWARGPSVF